MGWRCERSDLNFDLFSAKKASSSFTSGIPNAVVSSSFLHLQHTLCGLQFDKISLDGCF